MVDKLVSILTTALAVTAVGIALRPNSPLPRVLREGGSAFAKIQRASFGPQ